MKEALTFLTAIVILAIAQTLTTALGIALLIFALMGVVAFPRQTFQLIASLGLLVLALKGAGLLRRCPNPDRLSGGDRPDLAATSFSVARPGGRTAASASPALIDQRPRGWSMRPRPHTVCRRSCFRGREGW